MKKKKTKKKLIQYFFEILNLKIKIKNKNKKIYILYI